MKTYLKYYLFNTKFTSRSDIQHHLLLLCTQLQLIYQNYIELVIIPNVLKTGNNQISIRNIDNIKKCTVLLSTMIPFMIFTVDKFFEKDLLFILLYSFTNHYRKFNTATSFQLKSLKKRIGRISLFKLVNVCFSSYGNNRGRGNSSKSHKYFKWNVSQINCIHRSSSSHLRSWYSNSNCWTIIHTSELEVNISSYMA